MTANLHSLTGAYALNALDDVERAAFERHLRTCSDCAAEVASLADAAAAIPTGPTSRAPQSLRGATLAAAAATPQVGAAGPAGPRTAASPRRRAVTWLASAAAVAVVAVGTAVGWPGGEEPPGAGDAHVMSILSAPDAQTMDMPWGDGSYVVVSDSRRGALVMLHGVDMPTAGTEYQVWMVHDDGTLAPSSTFMPDPDGIAMAMVTGDMSHIVKLAITMEPRGGSPAPTGEVLASATV